MHWTDQYAVLRSQGTNPLTAALAVCRDNRGNLFWVVGGLSTKYPEQVVLRERWARYLQAEKQDRKTIVGFVDDGCYFYSSLLRRPDYTVFLRWGEIESIYAQDGQHCLALSLYSRGEHGGKFLQAQNEMEGFGDFVEEVSRRFFGQPSYLGGKFRNGGQPVRKFRVWPQEQNAEP